MMISEDRMPMLRGLIGAGVDIYGKMTDLLAEEIQREGPVSEEYLKATHQLSKYAEDLESKFKDFLTPEKEDLRLGYHKQEGLWSWAARR